jgi:hypothetical protein
LLFGSGEDGGIAEGGNSAVGKKKINAEIAEAEQRVRGEGCQESDDEFDNFIAGGIDD